MSVAIIAVIAVVLVLGVGLLIVTLMRRSQTVVPYVADRQASGHERVVAVDEQGRDVTEALEDGGPPRDDAAFESVLKDELDDLGR